MPTVEIVTLPPELSINLLLWQINKVVFVIAVSGDVGTVYVLPV